MPIGRASCAGCGATLFANANFCSACGFQVVGATMDGSGEPKPTFVTGFLEGLAGKPLPKAGTRYSRYHNDDSRGESPNSSLPGKASAPAPNFPEERPDDLMAVAGRYPLLSGLLLLSIPVSCWISYLTVRSENYAGINAIGLLIVPFSIFCWIFTTIRGIHLVGVRFWFIPSTYVALVGGVIALVLCMIMSISTHEAARHGRQVADVTLYVTAAILYGGCAVWSYFYNWRRTGSAILAISLTILQTLSASFVIGIFSLWLDGRNAKRYEREHGY